MLDQIQMMLHRAVNTMTNLFGNLNVVVEIAAETFVNDNGETRVNVDEKQGIFFADIDDKYAFVAGVNPADVVTIVNIVDKSNNQTIVANMVITPDCETTENYRNFDTTVKKVVIEFFGKINERFQEIIKSIESNNASDEVPTVDAEPINDGDV